MARRLEKNVKAYAARIGLEILVQKTRERKRLQAEKELHTKASNIIGHYWRRYCEKKVLSIRFVLRKKVKFQFMFILC
jgi:hypothetical protein